MKIRLLFKLIIPIIALIIPITLYMMQRQEKQLSYEVLSASKIVDVNSPIGHKIKVYFSGKKLEKLAAISVRIINSGNVPIKASDFENELQLSFGNNAVVLTQRVSDVFPDNLAAQILGFQNKVLIKPLLLNPNDQFTIEAFIVGEKSKIKLDARIEGIKHALLIERNKITSAANLPLLVGAFLSFIVFQYLINILSDIAFTSNAKLGIFLRSEIIFILLASGLSTVLLGVQFMHNAAVDLPAYKTVGIYVGGGLLVVLPLHLKLRSIKNKAIAKYKSNNVSIE